MGIVGRTGAGKSSIVQALFRTVEPENGSFYQIGANDALAMGLHTLRKNLSVIPQTPFLFKGSIARNIDPLETCTEEKIWWALETAGIREYIEQVVVP